MKKSDVILAKRLKENSDKIESALDGLNVDYIRIKNKNNETNSLENFLSIEANNRIENVVKILAIEELKVKNEQLLKELDSL